MGQRADPPLHCGTEAMSDEKDKDAQGTPPPGNQSGEPEEERTVFMPGGFTVPPAEPPPLPEPEPGQAAAPPPPPAPEPVAEAPPPDPAPPPAPAPAPAPTGGSTTGGGIAPRSDAVGIKVGDVLNHIFRVDRFLARGGMGEVFVGCNVNVDEKVAIKVMLPALAGDEKIVAMFRKEARTLTKLNHPALVQYRVLAQEPVLHVLYIVT